MKITGKNKELNDMEKIKSFLVELGFICISSPLSQNLIYEKNGEVIMIKNKRGEK